MREMLQRAWPMLHGSMTIAATVLSKGPQEEWPMGSMRSSEG